MLGKVIVHHYAGSTSSRSHIRVRPPNTAGSSPGRSGSAAVAISIVNMVCDVFLRVFLADNTDLGTACGKYFRCSVLDIQDQGTVSVFFRGRWWGSCLESVLVVEKACTHHPRATEEHMRQGRMFGLTMVARCP